MGAAAVLAQAERARVWSQTVVVLVAPFLLLSFLQLFRAPNDDTAV